MGGKGFAGIEIASEGFLQVTGCWPTLAEESATNKVCEMVSLQVANRKMAERGVGTYVAFDSM